MFDVFFRMAVYLVMVLPKDIHTNLFVVFGKAYSYLFQFNRIEICTMLVIRLRRNLGIMWPFIKSIPKKLTNKECIVY